MGTTAPTIPRSPEVTAMSMSEDEIKNLVRTAFPDAFLKKMIRGTFAAHREARRWSREKYDTPEAQNTEGWLRRAEMETNFRGAAELFDSLDGSCERIDGTGWNCTEVKSGGVVMVCKSVQAPGAMVEPSHHRQSLAKTNPPSLFDAFGLDLDEDEAEAEAEAEDETEDLLAVLTHSRFVQMPGRSTDDDLFLPGSLYIGCPTADFERYVWEMNLLRTFPEVVRECLPNTWDDEAVVTFLANSQSTPVRYGNRGAA